VGIVNLGPLETAKVERGARINGINVTLEFRRNGIRESTYSLNFVGSVSELFVVSIEYLVCFGDGNGDFDPISSRGDGGCLEVISG
jgi:hypothetical protein